MKDGEIVKELEKEIRESGSDFNKIPPESLEYMIKQKRERL